MFKATSKKQRTQIIKEYKNGINGNTLAKKYGISHPTVYRILHKSNVEVRLGGSRKYKIENENFFENINSEEKAYFLGIMLSDGWVNINKKNYQNEFGLAQAEQDKDIVYAFIKALKANNPVLFIKRRKEHWQDNYRISISSKTICKDLAKYGCTKNKTSSVIYPNIHESLDKHFIRGYFDGDGSIFLSNNRPIFSLIGTKMFITRVQQIFIKNLNVNNVKLGTCGSKDSNYKYLRFGNKKNVYNICNWMYQNATIYGQRKYNKYLQFFNI